MGSIEKGDFKNVDIIAKTLENYINFNGKTNDSEWTLDFKDSNLFLASSLDKLAKNLKAKADNDAQQTEQDPRLQGRAPGFRGEGYQVR